MKRRDALKNIGFAAGFLVATPSIISLLQSCTSDVKIWVPEFLTQNQADVLTDLTEIILPKTETLPSGKTLNVPQFIDKYLGEVLEDEDQEFTKMAFDRMISDVLPNTPEAKIEDITTESYKAMLDKFMLLKDDIDEERESNPEALAPTRSEFLNHLKYLMVSAYKHTEFIGKDTMVYDPIPTEYYCGDLEELTGGIDYSPNQNLF